MNKEPQKVAYSIKVMEEKDGVNVEVEYILKDFTLDLLCKLCAHCNVGNYGSANKFTVRKLLAAHCTFSQMYNIASHEDSATAVKKRLNSQLRMIEVLFHVSLGVVLFS